MRSSLKHTCSRSMIVSNARMNENEKSTGNAARYLRNFSVEYLSSIFGNEDSMKRFNTVNAFEFATTPVVNSNVTIESEGGDHCLNQRCPSLVSGGISWLTRL